MENLDVNNQPHLHGIIPPVITPLTKDEKLDMEGFAKVINHCIDHGVHGIFTLGSSGEAMSISRSEFLKTAEAAVKIVGKRVPLFIGAIDTCTARVIENIKELEQIGAEMVVITPGFYMQNTCQDEIIRHFEKICGCTALKVVVYNIPSLTHVNILPETILELSKNENIVAYKDSCANWEQFQRNLFLLENAKISVFNGAEELCSASLLFGADGCVPGLADFFPRLFVDMYYAAQQKDVATVFSLQKKVWDLRKTLFVGKSWMSAMKYIAARLGLASNYVASPIEPLTPEEMKRIDQILERNQD
jgi:dihydrodipicolinate synthase/N-acetylneuraminate lyase